VYWQPGQELKTRPDKIEETIGQGGFGVTYKVRHFNSPDTQTLFCIPQKGLEPLSPTIKFRKETQFLGFRYAKCR